ncbi:hypothetical protein OD91_2181 [Lutibacter sp. Hel_I_33_5]|uniref:hypothetical protein n=1 Tax=Lutibacter sp. Hel_I_33_5 TaxID=1566289 RepID=UPI0011A34386|nr:hypothetical protein [Lutibacter sp. Hel_I_33_5]TVZ56879.1 hypothetical protein OD91_2181 [Lutibacter sp. Hel_I_33_5]
MKFIRFLCVYFLLIFTIISCDLFYPKKSQNNSINTVVDFSTIDVYPSFKNCDSIIDKTKKTTCFRNTIHNKISEQFKNHSLTIKDTIDEVVYVDVLINSKGNISLKKITSTEKLKEQLPKLDSIIKVSVTNLPVIFPALKRGIPVSTEYQLPIKVLLND